MSCSVDNLHIKWSDQSVTMEINILCHYLFKKLKRIYENYKFLTSCRFILIWIKYGLKIIILRYHVIKINSGHLSWAIYWCVLRLRHSCSFEIDYLNPGMYIYTTWHRYKWSKTQLLVQKHSIHNSTSCFFDRVIVKFYVRIVFDVVIC